MKALEQHINYQRTGRYYTLGDLTQAKKLLFALHGYAQLAAYFIRKFNHLDPSEYFIVCPEAPHRFYKEGTSGRVGASWMTKEDRLTDINDYVVFLDEVWSTIHLNKSFETTTLLGFSQGGATASRWVAQGKASFDRFILWAAVFPPDMKKNYTNKFKSSDNFFVIGTSDEYSSVERAEEQINAINKNGFLFEFITFNGNHSIQAETLNKLLNYENGH